MTDYYLKKEVTSGQQLINNFIDFRQPLITYTTSTLILPGHDLRPDNATILVNQLNGRPLAIMCHAVPHQHVKLVLVVLDSQHHRHSLTDLHDTGHLGRPWTLAHLDLHPTLQVVTQEVSSNGVQHVHLEWPEGDGLLVEVVPGAPELPRLIPDLLHVRVVLDDDRVLHVASRRRGRSVRCYVMVRRRGHATGVEEDLEGGAEVSGARF